MPRKDERWKTAGGKPLTGRLHTVPQYHFHKKSLPQKSYTKILYEDIGKKVGRHGVAFFRDSFFVGTQVWDASAWDVVGYSTPCDRGLPPYTVPLRCRMIRQRNWTLIFRPGQNRKPT